MAKSATTVFPVPTSPMRSRCIRSVAVMSPTISRIACRWSLVSGQGRLSLSRLVSSRRFSNATPVRPRLATWRARPSISWRSNSSSSASRRRPRSASAHRARVVDRPEGLGQRRQIEPGPELVRGGSRGERATEHRDAADQPPDDLVAHPLGRGVDRQHPPTVRSGPRRPPRRPRSEPGIPAAPSDGRGRTGPVRPPAEPARPRWFDPGKPAPARRIRWRRCRRAARHGRSGCPSG